MRRYQQYQQAAVRENPGKGLLTQWLPVMAQLLTRVGLVALAIVTVWAGVVLYRWLDAPVQAVAVISPLQQVSQVELESIVSSTINGGFLSLDIDALGDALEAHPWVAKATVRRFWPGRIEIAVLEEVAIARWGQHSFLNQRGQILSIDDTGALASLPYLSGPEGSVQEVMGEYQEVSELLLAQGLKVSEFGMDKHRRWHMGLSSGISVWLGQNHALAKVRRFLRAWVHELNARKEEILMVDARYENGVAVLWR